MKPRFLKLVYNKKYMLSINVTNLLKIYYNITGTEYKYFEAMLKGEFFYFNVEMWLIIKMGTCLLN